MNAFVSKYGGLLIVAASVLILAAASFLLAPRDPALPEVVFDRDGVAWTQDGERVEEDHPLWDCETMGDSNCG